MTRSGQGFDPQINPREANPSVPSYREQEDRHHGISSLPIQIAPLMALQSAQKRLESFIRASFKSHGRFGAAVNIRSQLYESELQLETPTFWRGLDQSFVDVGGMVDELEDLEVIDERICGWAARFDTAVSEAREVIRGMTNVANAGDAQQAASSVQSQVYLMIDHSRDVVKRCEREAERVIDEMRSNMAGIFARIESERERIESEARQVHSPPRSSGWEPPAETGYDEYMSDPTRIRGSVADLQKSRDTQRRWLR